MTERILINQLHDHIDKEVTVAGWVNVRRDHGKLVFIDLRDRTGIVQTVALPNHEDAHKIAQNLRGEWVVQMTGIVNKRPEKMVNSESPTGDIELEITDIEVLAPSAELPFDKDDEIKLETRLDMRPYTLRSQRDKDIFKVQHEIMRAWRDFLVAEEFTEFQAPRLSGEDAEGGASVFEVNYYHDRKAYLATSPQLYKQIMVGVYERVFTTGNVFRGEKHATSRHLSEYTSLDFEMGFINDHLDIMRLETRFMCFLNERLADTCGDEFARLGATLPAIPADCDIFPHMKLREAQELIYEKTGEDCREEKDLEPAQERFMCEYAKEQFGSDFIFITHYPIEKTAFYAYEDPEDKGYTKYFDLLCRGVEITSGGQRIHHLDDLVERITQKGLDPEKFSFYLQAFKYGLPPHGGIGMGLERLTQKFLNLDNVREATLFPRDMNRIDMSLASQSDDTKPEEDK